MGEATKEETLKGLKLQRGQAIVNTQLDPSHLIIRPHGPNGVPKDMRLGIWNKDGLPASILNCLVFSLPTSSGP